MSVLLEQRDQEWTLLKPLVDYLLSPTYFLHPAFCIQFRYERSSNQLLVSLMEQKSMTRDKSEVAPANEIPQNHGCTQKVGALENTNLLRQL